MTRDYEPLTKLDIQALRRADEISLIHDADGGGRIVCIKRTPRKSDPFADEDKRYTIHVQSEVRIWGTMSPRTMEGKRASEHLHSRNPLQTLSHFLRAGDELRLEWDRDAHSNDHTRQAKGLRGGDLHVYSVNALVRRGGIGKPWLPILVDVMVAENSAVCMIPE